MFLNNQHRGDPPMSNVTIEESIRRAFGIFGTNASTIPVGSADDLMDAFRRYASSPDVYTFEKFKEFLADVRQVGCVASGLEYYSSLLETYIQRVPDLGWERCARQVWPLLEECKKWIEVQGIPLEKIGIRPVFSAAHINSAAYEIRAFLCNHSAGGVCDCGHVWK